MILVCNSLMVNDIEHLFIRLFAIFNKQILNVELFLTQLQLMVGE